MHIIRANSLLVILTTSMLQTTSACFRLVGDDDTILRNRTQQVAHLRMIHLNLSLERPLT